MFVIKCIGWFYPTPCPFQDHYLVWYNPEQPKTQNLGGWSDEIDEAMRFDSMSEAIETWRRQRMYDGGLRTDGHPDRPLTAFTIEVVEI